MPTYRPSNEVLKTRVEVEVCNGNCSCTLSEDGDLQIMSSRLSNGATRWTYLFWIPTECTDVALHPLQADELVLEPEVHRVARVGLRALRESKRSHTVVDADIYDRCPLCQTESVAPCRFSGTMQQRYDEDRKAHSQNTLGNYSAGVEHGRDAL